MRYLCPVTDLVELEPKVFEVDGKGLAVVRIGDDVFGFDARCTHKPGPLPEGAVTRKGTILCPWHLGTFDLRNGGRVLGGPPTEPLPMHPVKVVDHGVYLD